MQNVIINTRRGCYLNTNLSRRAARRANSFDRASLVNKWLLELQENKWSWWIRGLQKCEGYEILVTYCVLVSKSKGKLNKRLFKVIESPLSIAVKYAKRESGFLHENVSENVTYLTFSSVKISCFLCAFSVSKGLGGIRADIFCNFL